MKYDIFFSDLERKQVLQLPILPEELPKLSKSSSNEEFETFENGKYNIIGAVGLVEFSLECWLPGKNKNYSFQRVKNVESKNYISFLDLAMINKKPIRVIITRSDGTFFLNHIFTIESFEWSENRVGNYNYSISFKQWRDYSV